MNTDAIVVKLAIDGVCLPVWPSCLAWVGRQGEAQQQKKKQ